MQRLQRLFFPCSAGYLLRSIVHAALLPWFLPNTLKRGRYYLYITQKLESYMARLQPALGSGPGQSTGREQGGAAGAAGSTAGQSSAAVMSKGTC